jgi:Flp pilus assembly protein TadG
MIIATNRSGHFGKEESGSILVDFAVSISVVMMVTFGVLDCSRAVYIDHFLATAARSATRYAMVRGSSFSGAACSTPSTSNCTAIAVDVTNYVKSILDTGVGTTALTVSTTWPGTTPTGVACDTTDGNDSPGCVVSVQINYAFGVVLPFMPANTFVLTSSSAVAIAQ